MTNRAGSHLHDAKCYVRIFVFLLVNVCFYFEKDIDGGRAVEAFSSSGKDCVPRID